MHFPAAPDFSISSTSRCKELLFSGGVGKCSDIGSGGDIDYAVGGGCAACALGGSDDVCRSVDIGTVVVMLETAMNLVMVPR